MKFKYEDLFKAAFDILTACGESKENAEITAANMCRADARGITTHGTYLLSPIRDRAKAGQISLPTKATVETDSGAVAIVDGADGLGAVAGHVAVKAAIAKAKQYGISAVMIKNTNNIGWLACYTEEAAKEGMIALMSCNAAAAVAPWGGAEAFFGTNPIAIASYTGDDCLLSADMALSIVARGKIRKAARDGVKIPDNWATDEHGNFTTDPNEALKGALLPMGEAKGSAIALAVDVISGILPGASYAPDLKSFHSLDGKTGVGASLIVIDIEKFQPKETFAQKIGAYLKTIKNLKKSPGTDEIFIPGERKYAKENKSIKEGISLDDNAAAAIDKLLSETGAGWSLVEKKI